jgi:two-component system cell cycle sensor histidine kinase/response regulator CckA
LLAMFNSAQSQRSIDSVGKPAKLLRSHHLLIAAVFTIIIVGLLGVASIGMDVLTSMRAYVGGEGLWSKAQKDAVHYLLRYGKTNSEEDYQRYVQSLAVPLADHDARVEMGKPKPDLEKIGRDFIKGRNHPDDVMGMISLFRRYRSERHISHAINVWAEADKYLQRLHQLGSAVREELTSLDPNKQRVAELLAEGDAINELFPKLEDDFSHSLGDAARYARSVVFNVLVAGTLLALSLGLLVSYRLILSARDADERYRHLFDTASDSVILSDCDTGRILDANAALAELTGIPIAKLLGTRQSDLFGREIPAMPGSSQLKTGDLVVRRADGTSIPVDIRNNRGRFGSRAVDYSIVRDIRERRRLEEQLRDTARMESVGRLAGGVAHDFNNLLTVIAGHTQALKRLTGGEARDKADQIRRTAERAATLVRQLLAFSRKQPLQPQPLDLNRVVRDMEDMVRGVLNEAISLVMDLTMDLWHVDADPHQLEQIILNLCTNARDAMPDGGQLVIRTWNAVTAPSGDSGAEQECVGLEISDTGHGMDEATQRRAFEPFFTTKPQGKGTGLGLATVYGTVRQSGGQISLQSEVGRGTQVTITLPRAIRELHLTAEAEATNSTTGGETLLVVEDDPSVREVLVHGLVQDGYQVYEAANGREALDLFRTHRDEIALVITDLVMPEMGGIALGDRLREIGATTRILYITGYHQDLERYSPQQLPLCCGLLLKPFSPQVLAGAIRKALAPLGAHEPPLPVPAEKSDLLVVDWKSPSA